MAVSTSELILRFTGDARQLRQVLSQVEADLTRFNTAQLRGTQQSVVDAARAERQRISETVKSANQRLREEQRTAREVGRIAAQTARQAEQQEKIRERAAKSLADVQIREARRAAREIERALAEETRQRERAARAAQVVPARRSTTILAGAAGGVAALVGVSAANEIREAGAAWLDYSSKLQTTRIAFTQMLGSAQAAEDHLKELQRFALTTPFQFSELIDASQRMQALGFNAQQVIPILNDVGNAVAAAGGGSERLDRVVLALSQIQSKGKVATQELNQLAESGIPAFRILQEQLGKSAAEARKLVEDGKISSATFIEAFRKFSQINFGGLMEQQSRTFTGAMSNIKDALLQTSATAFEPLFEKLSKTALSFSQAAQSSQDFQNKLKTVGSVSSTIFDGLVAVTLAVRDAVRLAYAAISGQLQVITEGWRAVAHATAAAFFEALAFGRSVRGDLVGAAKAQRVAQDEMRLATQSAGRAFQAQGKVVREVIDIYKEAEARAKALKDAQAKVGGDVAGLSGVLRKKPAPTDTSQPTADRKGPDPAATARRLAELALANTITGLNAEEAAIARSLDRREIDFQLYAARIEVLEQQRHQQVITGLIAEAQAANSLREPQQKQIALAEIANKRQQEAIRNQNELNQLGDRRFSITERINEAIADQNKQIAEFQARTGAANTAVNDLIESLAKQGVTLTTTQQHWLRFNAQIIDSNEQLKALKATLEDIDQAVVISIPAIDPDTLAGIEEARRMQRELAEEIDRRLGGQQPPVPAPDFSLWKVAIDGVKEMLADFNNFASSAIVGGINGIAGALAQGVEAWALYGESIGKAMKKALAASLARIAGEATFQGALHAAWAIGSLAFGDFSGAAKHGIAAAKFFAVAAATAIGARALAGNSFASGSGGSIGSGAVGSRTTADRNRERDPIDLTRTLQRTEIHIFTHSEPGPGFDDAIVHSVIRDVEVKNGPLRGVIVRTAGA